MEIDNNWNISDLAVAKQFVADPGNMDQKANRRKGTFVKQSSLLFRRLLGLMK